MRVAGSTDESELMRIRLTSFWNAQQGNRSQMLDYDQMLVWVTVLLMLFGMVMVYSASISLPDSPKYGGYTNNYFLVRQALFIAIGISVGFGVFHIKVESWQKYAPYLFVFTLLPCWCPAWAKASTVPDAGCH